MKRLLFLASLLVGLALALAPIDAPRVIAQTFPGQTSPGYVPIGQGAAPIKWQPISGCALTSSGVLGCSVQNAQNGNYTIQASDCAGTVTFNSTSQATYTFPSASGFAANCQVNLANTGVYSGPSTARGVILSASGVTFPNQSNVLYPGQITQFTNIGGTWVETGYPWRQLWKPRAAVTFYADASSGSDSAADGLGTGSGANATLGQAYIRLTNFVDYSGGAAQATLSINGSFGSGDVLHIAGPLRGGQGNSLFVVNGNGTSTINATNGNPCAALFDKATVELINISCVGTGGVSCFTAATGSTLFFITSISTCNPGSNASSGGIVATDPGTKVEFVNVGFNFGAPAGGTYNTLFSIANKASIVWDAAESINFLGNATFNFTVTLQQHGSLIFGGTTFNLNSFTVTGQRFYESGLSQIETNGGGANYIPGNSAGQAFGGSVYDGGNPLQAQAGGAACASNTVPVGNGTTTAPTCEAVPNAALANPSVTVGNQTCTLGSSCEVRQTIGSGSPAAISQASTVYFGSQGGAGANQLDAIAVAIGGTFKNLTFSAGTTPAAGQTITITVLTGTYAQAVAGTLSASVVTCTISNPAVQCQDTTDSVAITAGNVFVIRVVTSATSGTITGSSWAVEFDNP